MIVVFDKTIVIILVLLFSFLSTEKLAYRIGNLNVSFSGSINEIYDDNITFIKDNRKHDLISKVSLGLDAGYEGKESRFDILGNISRRFFVNNTAFDNNSEEIALNYITDLSMYDRVNLKDSFSHTYEPRSLEDAFGRTNGRYSTYKNKFSLSYSKDFTQELVVLSRYINEAVNYSRSGIEDSYLNSFGLEGGYILTPFTNLNLSYDLSRRDFYSGGHSLVNSAALGIRKYMTKTFFIDGKTGIDLVAPYSGDKIQRSMYSMTFSNEIDRNSNAAFSFLKQFSISSFSPDIFDQWQFSGRLMQGLSERLGINLSAFYGEGKFIVSDIKDKNTGTDISLNYELRENLRGSVSYAFSEVTSTIDSREYSKNTISAGINAIF